MMDRIRNTDQLENFEKYFSDILKNIKNLHCKNPANDRKKKRFCPDLTKLEEDTSSCEMKQGSCKKYCEEECNSFMRKTTGISRGFFSKEEHDAVVLHTLDINIVYECSGQEPSNPLDKSFLDDLKKYFNGTFCTDL